MTRTRAMTEQAADAAIDTACRVLPPPTIRARFAETADKAERDQPSYHGFLADLFMAECEDRDHRRTERAASEHGLSRLSARLTPRRVGDIAAGRPKIESPSVTGLWLALTAR